MRKPNPILKCLSKFWARVQFERWTSLSANCPILSRLFFNLAHLGFRGDRFSQQWFCSISAAPTKASSTAFFSGKQPGNRGLARNRPCHTGFVAGSNWEDVAITLGGCFGIQADGTLWDLSEVVQGGAEPRLVGKEHGWKSISAGWEHICALKSDGTMWQWGLRQNPLIKSLAIAKVVAPMQIGTDSDWLPFATRAIPGGQRRHKVGWYRLEMGLEYEKPYPA